MEHVTVGRDAPDVVVAGYDDEDDGAALCLEVIEGTVGQWRARGNFVPDPVVITASGGERPSPQELSVV